METKSFQVCETKILDADQGIVETIFAIFGIIDRGKDISHPGMFTKTFVEHGQKVRVLDMHQSGSIMNVIGKPLELRELSKAELPPGLIEKHPDATGGAYAKVQFLMETPEGKGAFIRLKEGAIDEWSFGYDALDFDHTEEEVKDEKITVRNLRTVKLYEVGPVLWGMNEATVTLSAKGAEPSEAKPVEETENYVRVRVKDPGGFQEDSWKTITISKSKGILAVIGRLKGETTTTVQTYLFDKDKWSKAEAQKWVKDHKKGLLLMIEAKIDEAMDMHEQASHVSSAFRGLFKPQAIVQPTTSEDNWWVDKVHEDYLIAYHNTAEGRELFKVPYKTDSEGKIEFAPQDEWMRGEYQFVEKSAEAPVTTEKETGPETPISSEELLRAVEVGLIQSASAIAQISLQEMRNGC